MWQAKASSSLKQMAPIDAILTSTYHTKQLNPCSNSLVSRLVNYSWLSACQGDMGPFEGDQALVDVWQASEASHSKSNLGNFQHQYPTKVLINVCSYCLMVKKCVDVVCIKGGFSQIQSQILLFSDPLIGVALIQHEKHCTNHPLGATPSLCIQEYLQKCLPVKVFGNIKLAS